jgi:site-specific recombinase XerD
MHVAKTDWSNGRMKTGRGKQQNSHLQSQLDDLRKLLEKFYTDFSKHYFRSPVKEDFLNFQNSKKSVEHFLNKIEVHQITPLIEQIIEDRKEGRELNNGRVFADNTLKSYRTFLNTLKNFELTNPRLNTRNIVQLDTINRFQSHLIQSGLRLNTIGRRLKHLCTFLEELYCREIIETNPFKKFKISIPSEDSISIALNEEELEEMGQLDLSARPTHELVRDQFLAMAWTGLRISDFKDFVNLEINSQTVIPTHNKKTGKIAYIPILPPLKSILAKYHGKFSRMISEQKMRDYLKEIAMLMPSMQTKVEVQFTIGGKTQRVMKDKYNLVHLHTARRTLATNLYRRKFPMDQIMLITGHKTIAALKRYLKVTESEVLNDLVTIFEQEYQKDKTATIPATIHSKKIKTP